MNGYLSDIESFFDDYMGLTIPSIQVIDVIEVAIIAFFVYQILIWFKKSRAWVLLRGLLFIVFFFLVAYFFQMTTILWLGNTLLSVVVTLIIVVFQPELRKALEDLGRNNILSRFFALGSSRNANKRFEDRTLSDLIIASYEMGAVKTGALIVIERNDRLEEFERTGIALDAMLTRQLLVNIFEKNTPLHDGAIIVRGDRVTAATCYLPLSDNMNLSKDLGTRHRAAIGMSEACDAFVIVVSEETGRVSIAEHGQLQRNVSDEQLREALRDLQQLKATEEEETAEATTGKEGSDEANNPA